MVNREIVGSAPLPPPYVPLKVLGQGAALPPPAPPLLPGKEAVVKPSAAPGVKKERRMELQGLEPGDPRSTVRLIRRGMGNVARKVPPLLRKYSWVIPVVLMVWTVLGSFNAYKLMSSMPALYPLWAFLEKIVLFLVFLTAAYNNFIGKAVYGTLVVRVIIPFIRRIRRQGVGKVSADFKALIPGFKANFAEAGARSLGLVVFFSGTGAFLSNYLTRNNAADKIAVSLAIAFALMKALNDGKYSLPFVTSRVVMKDLFVAARRPSPVRNHHIYVAISGLTLGFTSSLLLAVLRKSMGENIGYLLGTAAMAAGAALFFARKSKPSDA